MVLNTIKFALLLTLFIGSLAEPSYISSLLDDPSSSNDLRAISVDKFGVERSFLPFSLRPRLFLHVIYDLYKDPEITPLKSAENMLKEDMAKYSKLKITWDIAVASKPTYNLQQLAAYAYSMSEPENLFSAFNIDTSAFRDNSDYSTYNHKGLFGLLLLSCKEYKFKLYRGVNFPVPAEVGQYIRFNRFVSSSTNLEIAKNYASTSTGQGTIFVINGVKHANHIAPYSIVPSDEEYLISQDTQFLITAISNVTYSDGSKVTQITMSTQKYNKKKFY